MNKIPKVLHYCWFGMKPLSELALKCIESWKIYCPDYEIKRWDESNFDVNCNDYVKEAYESKKWAFVADYARLYALLTSDGGIYLDTDVEMLKSLDNFLVHDAFFGFEDETHLSTAIIGSKKANPWINKLLHYYDGRHFIKTDGSFDVTTNVTTITDMTEGNYPFQRNNKYQQFSDGLTIYPMDWFSPKSFQIGKITLTTNTIAIHHFNASWWTEQEKINYEESLKRKNGI